MNGVVFIDPDMEKRVSTNRKSGCRLLLLAVATGIGSVSNCASNLPAQTAKPEATVTLPTESVPGIARQRPESGPFVEVEGGYMVPYTATIPGTEIEFEMVPIPGGSYLMGSPENEEDRKEDEGPQIRIEVDPFWMGKYEVTWSEYKSYMALHEYFKEFQTEGIREVTEERMVDAITAPSTLYDPSFTFDAGDDPRQPAATMTQYAAKQYTKWLALTSGQFYRLPAEAEWEYACRAGTTTPWSFGDDAADIEDYAWLDDNADYERHKVGKKKPNPWGLYDMHGNVAEWTLDQYREDGYKHLDAGKSYKAIDAINWPTDPDPYVARGGSWEMTSDQLRSAARLASNNSEWKQEDPNSPKSPWWFTTEPSTGVGFRLLRPYLVPATREDREKYWNADSPRDQYAIRFRIESEGRGARGLVDPELPAAIEKVRDHR
jgi:formylglycine-generating enzyme required for sulfatase activity